MGSQGTPRSGWVDPARPMMGPPVGTWRATSCLRVLQIFPFGDVGDPPMVLHQVSSRYHGMHAGERGAAGVNDLDPSMGVRLRKTLPYSIPGNRMSAL